MAMEAYDRAGAALCWRRCLELLPPESQQYAAIYHRIGALLGAFTPGEPTHAPPSRPADDSPLRALFLTGGSMLVSIVVYGIALLGMNTPPLLAMQLAAGFVVMILVHELGHVAAMRYYGLNASPPIFIPFMGALINLRQQPQNAKVEAIVGIGGPIAGTIGALACYAVHLVVPHDSRTGWLTFALAFAGSLLNLFNLLPVPPLDGGRITAALSPKVWILGLAGLVALIGWDIYNQHVPVVLILVLMFAWPRIRATWARRKRLDADPYYAVSRATTWTIGVLYVSLGVLLIAMYFATKSAFDQPF